jgi:hypothetical protein
MSTKEIEYEAGEKIKIFKGAKGRLTRLTYDVATDTWLDEKGTVYALPFKSWSVDNTATAGVGILSLPEHWAISVASRPHDYAYQTPEYQATHTRDEADRMEERNVYLLEKEHWTEAQAKQIAELAYSACLAYGAKYWDNKKTDRRRVQIIETTNYVDGDV